MNADFARLRRIALDGWLILRFTWTDVVHRPDTTVAEILEVLNRPLP